MGETIVYNGKTFPVVGGAGKAPTAAKRKAHRQMPKPLDGPPVASGRLSLSMPPPSVNTLFHNRKRGRGKTLRYRTWCALVDRELRDQESWHVPGLVEISVRVGGSGADSDNMLKAALDALVNAGRIEGDSPKHVAKSSVEHDPTIVGTVILIQGRT